MTKAWTGVWPWFFVSLKFFVFLLHECLEFRGTIEVFTFHQLANRVNNQLVNLIRIAVGYQLGSLDISQEQSQSPVNVVQPLESVIWTQNFERTWLMKLSSLWDLTSRRLIQKCQCLLLLRLVDRALNWIDALTFSWGLFDDGISFSFSLPFTKANVKTRKVRSHLLGGFGILDQNHLIFKDDFLLLRLNFHFLNAWLTSKVCDVKCEILCIL